MQTRIRQRLLYMLAQDDTVPPAGVARIGPPATAEAAEKSSTEPGSPGRAGRGEAKPEGVGGRGGRGEAMPRRAERGVGGRSFSRVPWHLLDELDAEKTKLVVSHPHRRIIILRVHDVSAGFGTTKGTGVRRGSIDTKLSATIKTFPLCRIDY